MRRLFAYSRPKHTFPGTMCTMCDEENSKREFPHPKPVNPQNNTIQAQVATSRSTCISGASFVCHSFTLNGM